MWSHAFVLLFICLRNTNKKKTCAHHDDNQMRKLFNIYGAFALHSFTCSAFWWVSSGKKRQKPTNNACIIKFRPKVNLHKNPMETSFVQCIDFLCNLHVSMGYVLHWSHLIANTRVNPLFEYSLQFILLQFNLTWTFSADKFSIRFSL